MTRTQVQEQVPRRVPAGTLSWLERELADWQAEGRVDAQTAAGIRARYEVGSRLPLARLLLGLGAAFVAVGVVWLGAANLDELSPLARFAGVAALWLGAAAAGELLDGRGSRTAVAALRGVTAVLFGAVVFQAAQSLQVPAYDPGLVGVWAAGALLHAYTTGAVPPLLVGIASGTTWLVMTVVDRVPSLPAGALAVLLAGVLCAVLATVHTDRVLPAFAAPWRLAGGLLALAGLFLAALPDGGDADVPVLLAVAAGGAALLAAACGAALGDRVGRQEAAASVGVLAAGLLVTQWSPPPTTEALLTGEVLARAVVAIALYLLAAVWVAGLGVLRDQPALTGLATGALVLFTVVQSFAVFQPLLSGAALFLALGAVLVGTGWLVERGRRQLVRSVESETDTGTGSSTEQGEAGA